MAYLSLTLADLKVALQDRVDNIRFWTDAEMRLAINETLRDWNLLTGKWRRRASYTTAAGATEYALGATLTYGMAVKVAGIPLIGTSIWDLDLGHPSWRTETTADGGSVPTVPTIWAPISLQQIVIWPAVSIGVVNALTVDGISATPVLMEDGDHVDLGQEHVDILLDYAVHCLAFKQGGPAWAATRPAFRAFLVAAGEENGRLKMNQKFRRAAGLDYRRWLQPTQGGSTQLDGILESK